MLPLLHHKFLVMKWYGCWILIAPSPSFTGKYLGITKQIIGLQSLSCVFVCNHLSKAENYWISCVTSWYDCSLCAYFAILLYARSVPNCKIAFEIFLVLYFFYTSAVAVRLQAIKLSISNKQMGYGIKHFDCRTRKISYILNMFAIKRMKKNVLLEMSPLFGPRSFWILRTGLGIRYKELKCCKWSHFCEWCWLF